MKITSCWIQNKFLTENSSWEARIRLLKGERTRSLTCFIAHPSRLSTFGTRVSTLHDTNLLCLGTNLWIWQGNVWNENRKSFWTSFKDDPQLWDLGWIGSLIRVDRSSFLSYDYHINDHRARILKIDKYNYSRNVKFI